MVSVDDHPKTVGDEPLMLKIKYGDQIQVCVGEKRVEAIPNLLTTQPDNDLIILDDAFQHRSVRPSLSVLLTPYSLPFYEDFILPAGRLREARNGAARSDVVIITRCPPEIGFSQKLEIEKKVKLYSESADVFFSTMKPSDCKPMFPENPHPTKSNVIAIAAIGDPDQFFSQVAKDYHLKGHLAFSDHYEFSKSDVSWMIRLMEREDAMLLCTEKDAIKLRNFDELKDYPVYIQPIEFSFLEKGAEFHEILDSTFREFERDF